MNKLNKKDVQEFDTVNLLNAFYWLGIRTANEENSKRGVTKITLKEEEIIINELAKRFGFNPEELKEKVNK